MKTYCDYTPKEISSLLGLVDTYKRWYQQEHKHERSYENYHPSELGKCLRAQQYKHYAYLGFINLKTESLDSKMLRLFDKGHNMHERWAAYFDDMQVLRGRWKCKNPVCFLFDDSGVLRHNYNALEVMTKGHTRIYGDDEPQGVFKPKKCLCGCCNFYYLEINVVSKKLKIKGRADVIIDCSKLNEDSFGGVRRSFDLDLLPKNGSTAVGDMKSIGQSAWDFQLAKRGPHKSYLIQLVSYMHILDCDYGVLMYENKNNSELKWYKVDRNEKWWKIIQEQVLKMGEMSKEKKLPPPRSMKKDNFECKVCEFKTLCHKSKIWKDTNLKAKRENFYKDLL